MDIVPTEIKDVTAWQARAWLATIAPALYQNQELDFLTPHDMRLTSVLPVREFEGVIVLEVEATSDTHYKVVDPYFVYVPGASRLFNKCQLLALEADLKYRFRMQKTLLDKAKRKLVQALSLVDTLRISDNAKSFVRIELGAAFADIGNGEL